MKTTGRLVVSLVFGAAILCMYGCPVITNGGVSATTPAPCSSDDDCPEGIACLFPSGTDQPGICDVDETQVTSGTPAPCMSDGECPDGVSCIFAGGADQPGFCDIQEQEVR